ncbi:hypothetical protein AGMMS49965_09200 [Bacteroidia bacterium]|nr:hypothetical protein AGMMS49965_09200 [Bacteroidia bacterium]
MGVGMSCKDDDKKVALTSIRVESTATLPLNLIAGQTATLTAKAVPENAGDVKFEWSSDNTAVATVSDGVVTAVAPGETNIVVKSGTVNTQTAITVVAAEVPLTAITLSPDFPYPFFKGMTHRLEATPVPADATGVEWVWESSDEATATVANGLVTAVDAGSTVIKVKSGSIDTTINVTVNAGSGETLNFTANLAATDALGRKLPDYNEVGSPKSDKYVALFYWTWHTGNLRNPSYDVSKILAEHPDAINDYNDPAWLPYLDAGSFFWGEPLFGYYIDTDNWVLWRHAEMLALAGVDVLFFDCTNPPFTWKESYMELCKVFTDARAAGLKTPQIAFMTAFGPGDGSKQTIEAIYNDLYKPGLYKDLWFIWKDKPIIMGYPELMLSAEIRNFFTFRPGQPSYSGGPTSNRWGWLEISPQQGYMRTGSGYEQMTVGVAQNWSKARGLTAMNAPNTFGRSYTRASGEITTPGAVNWGYNFQEQWDRALDRSPQVVFITGWNEWIAGRFEEWQGQVNAFPDQFSQEKSRDIEPMKGGHGDNYYYQMALNIRKFKGIEAPELPTKELTIALDGEFDEWLPVGPHFATPKGNTIHRASAGKIGEYYTNNTGRNDITGTKVARDADNIYFYVETAANLTPSSDPSWMRLFIDADRNKTTGWEGYDFVLNRVSPTGNKALLERHNGTGWQWESSGQVDFVVKDKQMEIKIPRNLLNMTGKLNFEFKWADNLQDDGDVMDFYLNGDAAPIGRFNFFYQEK